MRKITIYILVTIIYVFNSYAGGIDFSGLGSDYHTTRINNGVKVHHNTNIEDFSKYELCNLKGEEVHWDQYGWGIHETSLFAVERRLGINLIDEIKKQRKLKPNKELVIVDWGCGDGSALRELRTDLRREMIDNVKLVGFADLYSDFWGNTKEVEYVFDSKDNISDYFKRGEIDIMFSHYGLYHFLHKECTYYFYNLTGILSKDAVVVFNHCFGVSKPMTKIKDFYNITTYYNGDAVERVTRLEHTSSSISCVTRIRSYIIE